MRGILIYVGGFQLPDKNAAAQRVVANGKMFRSLGYDVVFIGTHVDVEGAGGVRGDTFFGFTCYSEPYPRTARQWLRRLVQPGKVGEVIRGDAAHSVAAVICYNHPAVAQLRIQGLCRRRGIACVADVTEWYGASHGHVFFRIAKWLDTTLRMRCANRRADGLITTSSMLTAFYSSNGAIPIVELPTLYDSEEVESKGHTERDMTIADRPVRWIYAGSPFLKDRLDIVIEVACRLNEEGVPVDLSIYGLEVSRYLAMFPHHAELLDKFRGHLSFRGRRERSEVLEALRQSDYSVFFRDSSRSTCAGFPSKLAESITFGVPVITNYLPNLRSYKSNVPGLFLVDISDVTRCAKEVKRILRTPRDVLAAIRERALDERPFDFRTYTGKVRAFLSEVLR